MLMSVILVCEHLEWDGPIEEHKNYVNSDIFEVLTNIYYLHKIYHFVQGARGPWQ